MEAQHRRSLYAGAVHCIRALILIKCGRSFTLHTEEPEIPCIMMTAVYTGVIVFKSDLSFPERMEEKDWYQVDVLTCAAPNLRNAPSNFMNPCAGDEPADIAEDALYKLHLKRIEKLFRVAAANKAEVLILGAFGCGAFCNPPEIVAKAFREVQKKYESYFEVIEYAIFCAGYETKNYKAFSKAFGVEKE